MYGSLSCYSFVLRSATTQNFYHHKDLNVTEMILKSHIDTDNSGTGSLYSTCHSDVCVYWVV